MEHARTDFGKETLVPTPFRGLRVLVFDHDTTTLSDIASVLEQHFYTVTTTELATTALAMLHKGDDQFDLVMADVNMTEMDVFAFLKVIQLLGDIPIILMSSKEDREMARKAREEGVCFVFQKPISPEHLKNIWQHVHRKRSCPKVEPENQGKLDMEDDPDDGIVEEGNNKANMENIRPENKKIMIDQVGIDNVECVGESSEVAGGPKRKRSNVSEGKRKCGRRGNSSMEWNGRKEDINEEDDGSSGTKWRIRWTPDLHRKFTDVIRAVGKRACPKTVLRMMNVPNITHRQVASHLQKYRVQMKRAREALAGFNKYAENRNAFKQANQQDNIMKLPVPHTLNSGNANANAPGLHNPLFGSVFCKNPPFSEHAGHAMDVPHDNQVSSHLLNISDIRKFLKLAESPVGNSSIKF